LNLIAIAMLPHHVCKCCEHTKVVHQFSFSHTVNAKVHLTPWCCTSIWLHAFRGVTVSHHLITSLRASGYSLRMSKGTKEMGIAHAATSPKRKIFVCTHTTPNPRDSLGAARVVAG
jgi:hypothetical protein